MVIRRIVCYFRLRLYNVALNIVTVTRALIVMLSNSAQLLLICGNKSYQDREYVSMMISAIVPSFKLIDKCGFMFTTTPVS
jgi:hypothetical protein